MRRRHVPISAGVRPSPSSAQRDCRFLVELGWCLEYIEGDIWAAGSATVALPSGGAH